MAYLSHEGEGIDKACREKRLGAGPDEGQPSSIQASEQEGLVTITGKPSVDVPPGTENNVLKQAGLKK